MTSETNQKPPHNPPDPPNWRQPVGIILILLLILLWSGFVLSIIERLSGLNFWLQLPVYIFAGIAWIFPVKPLLIWMNTGKFRS